MFPTRVVFLRENYILWLTVITSSTEKSRVSGGTAHLGYQTVRDNVHREIQVYNSQQIKVMRLKTRGMYNILCIVLLL